MKFSLIILFLVILAGCAPAGVWGEGPVTAVSTPYGARSVQKVAGAGESWAAIPDLLTTMRATPQTYAGNIAAIESHTGCRVDPATVSNTGMQTTAMVKC